MKFENKCVVVTGAGSGIGRATVLAFATEGAMVVAGGINLKGAGETVELISQKNGKAVACRVDVSDPQSV